MRGFSDSDEGYILDYDKADVKEWRKQTDFKTIEKSEASSSTAYYLDGRTPSDLRATKPQHGKGSIARGFNKNSASDILINAYITKLESYIASWVISDTNKGLDIRSAGEVIRLSESYLQSLNSYSQYRIFLSSISMSVKANSKDIDAKKAQSFLRAISDFKKSGKTLEDSKSFSKKISSFGLSPVALEG